jgi:hypothetical protein
MAARACQTKKLASWSAADAADRRTMVGCLTRTRPSSRADRCFHLTNHRRPGMADLALGRVRCVYRFRSSATQALSGRNALSPIGDHPRGRKTTEAESASPGRSFVAGLWGLLRKRAFVPARPRSMTKPPAVINAVASRIQYSMRVCTFKSSVRQTRRNADLPSLSAQRCPNEVAEQKRKCGCSLLRLKKRKQGC